MPFIPMVYAFVIGLVGGVAVGLRPGYPFGAILLGAILSGAMTGLAATAVQFVPRRFFVVGATVGGLVVALLVVMTLQAARILDVGPIHNATFGIWPVAAVTALLLSRASGMKLPRLRRRRDMERHRLGRMPH